MQISREDLDRRLAALDEAIVMLREDAHGPTELLMAFAASADDILALSGNDRDHVNARLRAILAANGLADR